jgi:hypothetical protein
MKKGLTHIIFIVDRSGSMSNIAKDMIGGYNTFIKQQKELPNECYVSFYKFDDIYETLFERIKLENVVDLDETTYVPRGSTALHDAMGKTFDEYGQYLYTVSDEERPERVLVVTITDGYENASRTYALAQIRDKIKLQTETYNWDFVFMGSNIDAWGAGSALGVLKSSTLQFASSGDSVAMAFASLGDKTSCYRAVNTKMGYAFSKQDQEAQDQFLEESKKLSKSKKTQPKV